MISNIIIKKQYYLLLFFVFSNTLSFSQDIIKIKEDIKKNKPLIIKGGFSANTVFYGTKGMDQRRDPFSWMINANINFKIYGIIDVPFSANLTNQNRTFNQPSYNLYGISPRYKDLTLHIGYRNMQLSTYSLSGITFLGVGIEYSPKETIFKFKGMYGRLVKAINIKDSINNNVLPAYERWGYGGKLSIGKNNHNVELILFRAKDDEKSIDVDLLDYNIKPKENLVLGINTTQKIGKRVSLNVDYTFSAFTEDTRMNKSEFNSYTYLNNLGDLYTPRNSSKFNKAIVSKIDYQADLFSVGISFKYVDPNYKSLGSNYLSNDIKDYLFNASTKLFKGKLNLSGNIGKQENNLDNSLLSTTKRVIVAVNCSYSINKSLNLSLNYSNFSSSTRPSLLVFVDSIEYVQVTTNTGFVANYNFGDDDYKHGFMLNITHQNANTIDKSLNENQDNTSKLINLNLSYRLNFIPSNIAVNTAVNYNSFNMINNTNKSFAPTVGIQKSFYNKKIRCNLSYSYISSFANNSHTNNMNTLRLNTSFKYNKHHSFKFYTNCLIKNKEEEGDNNKLVKEYRAGITYNYIF